MADNVSVRARCIACGAGLGFTEWSQGLDRCPNCSSKANKEEIAYVAGPPSRRLDASSPAPDGSEFAKLLDDLPDELVDELAAALEAASLPDAPPRTESAISGFLAEVGFGLNPRESIWATWGFSVGFGLNVVLAKFAQMSTSAPMHELLMPIAVGGLVVGGAGAAIGWGLAKLKET